MSDGLGAAPVHRSFLAFDFGTRRVGVASGNTVTRTAQPLSTIAATGAARFDAIGKLVAECHRQAFIIKRPKA